MALVRSTSIYLWHAQSPDQVTLVEFPARPTSESLRNVNRRQSTGAGELQGPVFRSVQIAPGGDRIYTIEQSQGSPCVVRLWELASHSGAKTVRARELAAASDSQGIPEGVISSALGRDGKLLAVADRSGQVVLLDASRLVVVGTLQASVKEPETFFPTALAISPDGTELAVGSQQGTISLWSVARPARPELRLHLPGHRAYVANLVYDPRARRLASATFDPIVEVWDLEAIDRELIRLRLAD
jgi:WD40 repeat protein